MKPKRCIIVHGCPSSPGSKTYNKHWMPWVKKELERMGIETFVPLMPEPWKPVYEEYKKVFERYEVDENTVLVGHSCGCAFLVRWLGETKRKIRKLILVAPWKINTEWGEYGDRFYNYEIDPSIKDRVDEIVFFTSDDEEQEGKKSLELFHSVLGGRMIELEKHGHYTLGDMGTEEFPELVKEILAGS